MKKFCQFIFPRIAFLATGGLLKVMTGQLIRVQTPDRNPVLYSTVIKLIFLKEEYFVLPNLVIIMLQKMAFGLKLKGSIN
jgi:hypothetical protein